jgi:hypothetical protein
MMALWRRDTAIPPEFWEQTGLEETLYLKKGKFEAGRNERFRMGVQSTAYFPGLLVRRIRGPTNRASVLHSSEVVKFGTTTPE